MAGNSSVPGRSVASRVLDLLGTFDATTVRQSLSQMSRRSGIPVGTCHRMVQDLLAWGALERHEDGLYTVGGRLARLGMLAPVQRGLRQVAAPILQDVYLVTRLIVNLQVLDDDRVLVLDRLAGTNVGRPVTSPGDRLVPHISAGGKVLLAYSTPEVAQRVLERSAETGAESMAPAVLERMLAQVRQQGYGRTEEEVSPNTFGLAVPVFDAHREVIAALGVVSLVRVREAAKLVPVLQVASAAITRALGSPY